MQLKNLLTVDDSTLCLGLYLLYGRLDILLIYCYTQLVAACLAAQSNPMVSIHLPPMPMVSV